jgi:hypothetical protein
VEDLVRHLDELLIITTLHQDVAAEQSYITRREEKMIKTIISGVINTRFNYGPNGRSVQRTPMQIMAVAFAAFALPLVCRVIMGVAGFAVLGMSATLGGAQTEVKEKPPLYRYVSHWTFPRDHWGT